jgi:RNA polymerase subunit RPABC4/transcription elongation factor Spt4
MPASRGRHCRRCRARISHRLRLCPLCRAVNLEPVDYVIITLSLAGLAALALRWA